MPRDYKNQVKWVFKAYKDAGVNLTNGFQKDDIQNHQGARKSKKWDNWKCDISIIKNEKGMFLVCEDSGTYGLTGENMSVDSITEKVNNGEKFAAEERLARFTSMNISGDNQMGGGLYGVGKTVYSAASKDCTYYFDSLRDDGKYVANINKEGSVLPQALENEEAKKYIKSETGFDSKKTVGTRIIIPNPEDDIVEGIRSGEMVECIQESWWLIMERLPESAGISVNGKKVVVPERIKKAKYPYELPKEYMYHTGYRVKHFGFYLFENDEIPWNGISYYRKGMKIGEVDLKKIPESIRGKYWGYIEVDEPWENELADIEDAVHFGVSKGERNKRQYQYLKNFCSEQVENLLLEWGFIKNKENSDEKLKKELDKIAEEVQDLFDVMEFEDLGKGPQKADFDIRWKDIEYPSDSLTVTSNERISFKTRIKSNYLTDKKIEYTLYIVDQYTKNIVYELESNEIDLKSQEVKELCYEYEVNPETASRYNENRIVFRAKVIGSGKNKVKELPFFYDCDKPQEYKENVVLTLHNCDFPVEGSKRVDFGDRITNVEYRVDNNRNEELNYLLNISVHNASDPNTIIENVAIITGKIKPYEETIIKDIPDIVFDKKIYSQYLDKGNLQLRAKLVANEDSHDFRKGDRITKYYYNIFLNMDEKNGKRDAFEVINEESPKEKNRSWIKVNGNDRYIVINVGHNAYIQLSDYPDIQHSYLKEQVLKQYILLYLREGKYSVFDNSNGKFQEKDSVEASESVIEKIEEVLYESLEKKL